MKVFRKYSVSVLALLVILAGCDSGAKEHKFPELISAEADTVYSYYGKLSDGFLIENEYYKPYSYDVEGRVHSFIFKVKETELFAGAEGNQKKFEISPVYASNKISDWSVSMPFDNFSFRKNVLTGEVFATNDSESSFFMYNIESGASLMDYTYGNLEVHFPDGISKRYFGFYSSRGLPSRKFSFGAEVLGYFTFASEKEKIQLVELKARSLEIFEKTDKNTPTLEFEDTDNERLLKTSARSVYYSGIDSPNEQMSDINLAFRATFYVGQDYSESVIVFPIVNGALDKDAIIYDKALFQLNFK
jgi:hypothetical protein